ncbi:MAG: nickel insertion protein, partial [Lachnospiraceae bacterium]
MSRTLYVECTSGISGDMFTASLLDLGASEEILQKALNSLSVQGFQIEITRVKKSGLDACDFNVILDKEHENHDHDMNYLYGKTKGKHHHEISHEHRNLAEIIEIIEGSDITKRAKMTAVHIFEILAEAEARVHGTTMEQVHFHEVGAVDSIVGIVSAAV